MNFEEMKQFVRDLSSRVREIPIRDGQPYNTRIVGWRLVVTAEGKTYDIQRGYTALERKEMRWAIT